MEAKHISYLAVVLTKNSQAKIKGILRYHNFDIPEHWTKYMHHMTVRFKRKGDFLPLDEMPPLGTMVWLDPLSYRRDDNGACISVLPYPDKETLKMPQDQTPHITIATAPGVPPVYSNDLLRDNRVFPFGFNENDDFDHKLQGYLCAVGYDKKVEPWREELCG